MKDSGSLKSYEKHIHQGYASKDIRYRRVGTGEIGGIQGSSTFPQRNLSIASRLGVGFQKP
jgi:hypothetical protein